MIPELLTPSPFMAQPDASHGALAHSDRVARRIREEISASGGWIPFSRYMELALYAPGLGYYSAGARKLGRDGDFITAPELSPLFGHTVARQIKQVIDAGFDEVLEVGAGSGALAATVLEELERLDALPRSYLILEVSADLRERSRDTLAARVPHLLERVAWLNRLPPLFSGVILGNEVLDAMPTDVIRVHNGKLEEAGVCASDEDFQWAYRPATGELLEIGQQLGLEEGYRTEVQRVARAFIRSVLRSLDRGVALFIDYGFPAREYYHPQRDEGTLMCHHRHQAHDDPFHLPGLQDITTHVDFSAVAEAGVDSGADLLGYTSQAQFLINAGITDLMAGTPPEQAAAYLPLANQVNRLVSPAEMGELFKAIAFGRQFDQPLLGFSQGDRRHAL
jgi:SAM-dependent MidA family methyltransferase